MDEAERVRRDLLRVIHDLKATLTNHGQRITALEQVVVLGASQIERNAIDLGALGIGNVDADLT